MLKCTVLMNITAAINNTNYKLSSSTIKNLSKMYTCLVSVIMHNSLWPLQGAPIKTTHPKRYCISAVVLRIWTKVSDQYGSRKTTLQTVTKCVAYRLAYTLNHLLKKSKFSFIIRCICEDVYFPTGTVCLLAQPVHMLTVNSMYDIAFYKQLENMFTD